MNNIFQDVCDKMGFKLTDQRLVIAQLLFDAPDHPNVEELYARANEIDSNIGLSTVYRTVNLLENYGLIQKLDFQDGKARYEWNISEDNHHHHLIDIETGHIIEFQDDELEALKTKIARKLGYELVDHRLELYGKKL